MSKNCEIQKSEQLGINIGKANLELRKQIMFRLVQKCNEDLCFKCGKRIESADELSIEHKEPWLHIDPKLFWVEENLSWSHRKCNRADRFRNKIGPEGTA